MPRQAKVQINSRSRQTQQDITSEQMFMEMEHLIKSVDHKTIHKVSKMKENQEDQLKPGNFQQSNTPI